RPDAGMNTTPNLIRRGHINPPIQAVRDIQPLHCCSSVRVRPRLLADQAQLAHQPAHLEATDAGSLVVQLVRLPAELRRLLTSSLTWALRATRSASTRWTFWRCS